MKIKESRLRKLVRDELYRKSINEDAAVATGGNVSGYTNSEKQAIARKVRDALERKLIDSGLYTKDDPSGWAITVKIGKRDIRVGSASGELNKSGAKRQVKQFVKAIANNTSIMDRKQLKAGRMLKLSLSQTGSPSVIEVPDPVAGPRPPVKGGGGYRYPPDECVRKQQKIMKVQVDGLWGPRTQAAWEELWEDIDPPPKSSMLPACDAWEWGCYCDDGYAYNPETQECDQIGCGYDDDPDSPNYGKGAVWRECDEEGNYLDEECEYTGECYDASDMGGDKFTKVENEDGTFSCVLDGEEEEKNVPSKKCRDAQKALITLFNSGGEEGGTGMFNVLLEYGFYQRILESPRHLQKQYNNIFNWDITDECKRTRDLMMQVAKCCPQDGGPHDYHEKLARKLIKQISDNASAMGSSWNPLSIAKVMVRLVSRGGTMIINELWNAFGWPRYFGKLPSVKGKKAGFSWSSLGWSGILPGFDALGAENIKTLITLARRLDAADECLEAGPEKEPKEDEIGLREEVMQMLRVIY